MPDITDTLTINGYSQPGSTVNTANSPAAFNGTLTIEINGENLSNDDALFIDTGADDSIIRGLVINRVDGSAIMIRASNVVVQGNYIGTDNTGLVGVGNVAAGVNNSGIGTALNALVGGLTAASRNIISANESAGSYPGEGWTIQGNYIGLDATGMAALGNATVGGSGGLSIDGVNDVTVGGAGTAQNVISGNLSHGVAPHETTGLVVDNNLVGLARDGTTILGNGAAGIVLTESQDATVTNNQISGAQADGIYLDQVDGADITDNIIIDNSVTGLAANNSSSVNITNNTITDSTGRGVSLDGSTDMLIQENTITDNASDGVSTSSSSALDILDNTISSNDGSARGIALAGTTDTLIQENTITDNASDGIRTATSGTVSIVDNDVSNNQRHGIDIASTQGTVVQENTITDNVRFGIRIDAGANSSEIYSNIVASNTGGVSIVNSSNTVIGDTGGLGNEIYDNAGEAGVLVSGIGGTSSGTIVQANYIGVDDSGVANSGYAPSSGGVVLTGNSNNALIGGTQPTEGNVIVANNSAGIVVGEATVSSVGVFSPSKNSILGNTIYNNEPGSFSAFSSFIAPGLSIDLLGFTISNSFVPQATYEAGPTLNDAGDADTGANNYMNFPVLNAATQTGTSLALNYDLDAEDSPTDEYRVEFFANDIADPSGHGEGQAFLGAVTASNGDSNIATLSLPNGTDLTGKVISATTTAIDSTTDSGFGSTSEFSAVLSAQVVAAPTSPTSLSSGNGLTKTGQNTFQTIFIGTSIVSAVLAVLMSRRKYIYRIHS
ncbi:right-handed parallel beta-helix repeat-containing protein [Candidatus Saccharibacteria bacterium]|nr:MAG: right-handed parallel beta-helix repeat-containing protein [Candidatus Saccharibacteria bacterium]